MPDILVGGSLRTGVTGIGFIAAQGGRIDNELRFIEEELFVPTDVVESMVGTYQPYAAQDNAGTTTYYPDEWSKVPFLQELVIVSTDKRMLDNWQSFAATVPVNNPLYATWLYQTMIGENPMTVIQAGQTRSLAGSNHAIPLTKILYARLKTYQGGTSSSGFQQINQDTWGGASVFAAESLYWMRALFFSGTAAPTGASGNVTTFFKAPDLNLMMTGVNAKESDLSFIMGLRQNLGPA